MNAPELLPGTSAARKARSSPDDRVSAGSIAEALYWADTLLETPRSTWHLSPRFSGSNLGWNPLRAR